MVKIIWVFVGLNTTALIFFIGLFLASTENRHVDGMEKGWMTILAGLGLLVILLAAIPLRISHSSFSIFVAAFFAALPSVIALSVLISKNFPSLKKKPTMATTYYEIKKQRAIAAAIEQGDTALLLKLVKGEDMNIQGNRVWDWDGLNYLQFAVRLRSNPGSFPFNDEANKAAIRILVAEGCVPTPALAEAIRYLPPDMITYLLDAGANPNTPGFGNLNPLIFQLITGDKKDLAIAVLLLQRGADVNAKGDYGFTPVMYAAFNAGTRKEWTNTWRLVRFLLEEANADFTYTTKKGINLGQIIGDVKRAAAAAQVVMPADFTAVIKWLEARQVDMTATSPIPG